MAWREKREEIEARTPGVRKSFVYAYSLQDYEHDYGAAYQKPGLLARFFALVLKAVPKVGPFKPLAFEPLAFDVEQLFLESAVASRTRYQQSIAALRRGQLHLPNIDFDTGVPPAPGKNRLADRTYADLLHKLAGRDFKEVPDAVRHDCSGTSLPSARKRRRSRFRGGRGASSNTSRRGSRGLEGRPASRVSGGTRELYCLSLVRRLGLKPAGQQAIGRQRQVFAGDLIDTVGSDRVEPALEPFEPAAFLQVPDWKFEMLTRAAGGFSKVTEPSPPCCGSRRRAM